ncbi:MAG: hypothetical protein KGM96_07195 [Acidobacteriota bacterium]|nr:hypothetical protein [Acidobacteriota bacterium]
MESNRGQNPNRAASDQTSRELRRMLIEYEALRARQERAEKLAQQQSPAPEADPQVVWDPVEHLSSVEGLTVITRLGVVLADRSR